VKAWVIIKDAFEQNAEYWNPLVDAWSFSRANDLVLAPKVDKTIADLCADETISDLDILETSLDNLGNWYKQSRKLKEASGMDALMQCILNTFAYHKKQCEANPKSTYVERVSALLDKASTSFPNIDIWMGPIIDYVQDFNQLASESSARAKNAKVTNAIQDFITTPSQETFEKADEAYKGIMGVKFCGRTDVVTLIESGVETAFHYAVKSGMEALKLDGTTFDLDLIAADDFEGVIQECGLANKLYMLIDEPSPAARNVKAAVVCFVQHCSILKHAATFVNLGADDDNRRRADENGRDWGALSAAIQLLRGSEWTFAWADENGCAQLLSKFLPQFDSACVEATVLRDRICEADCLDHVLQLNKAVLELSHIEGASSAGNIGKNIWPRKPRGIKCVELQKTPCSTKPIEAP